MKEWLLCFWVDQSMLNIKSMVLTRNTYGHQAAVAFVKVQSNMELHQVFDGCCIRPKTPVVPGATVD